MSQPQYAITSGRRARNYKDEDGKRRFGAWRVSMEVQLSPLSITSDTFEFYLYKGASDGDGAIERAGAMLEHMYRKAKPQPDGFPKPTGMGTAEAISDQQFRLTWQQAEKEGRRMTKVGDPIDPVAFHIKPKTNLIITPR